MEVIFYHSNCFDGVSAAALYVIGKGFEEGEYRTIPIVYFDNWKEQLQFIEKTIVDLGFDDFNVKQITFLDYCPELTTVKEINTVSKCRILIVDHHPIIHELAEQICNLDPERNSCVVPAIEGDESGASLVYELYKPIVDRDIQFEMVDGQRRFYGNIPVWVKHIRDNDLGIWEYDVDTRKFLTWLGTHPFEVDTYIRLMKEFNLEEALNAGAPIVEYQDALVGNQYATRETHEVNGVNVNFINAFGAFHTLLGRKINTEDPNSLAVIWYYADGNYRFRFNNGLKLNDISRKVAVSLGGGGHPRSSGARLSGDKSVMEMMNIIKLKVNEVTKGETNDIPISETGKEIDQS